MPLRGQDGWRCAPIFRWGLTDALPGLREGAAAFGLFAALSWGARALGGGEAHAHGGGAHGGADHGVAAAAAPEVAGAPTSAHH